MVVHISPLPLLHVHQITLTKVCYIHCILVSTRAHNMQKSEYEIYISNLDFIKIAVTDTNNIYKYSCLQ